MEVCLCMCGVCVDGGCVGMDECECQRVVKAELNRERVRERGEGRERACACACAHEREREEW